MFAVSPIFAKGFRISRTALCSVLLIATFCVAFPPTQATAQRVNCARVTARASGITVTSGELVTCSCQEYRAVHAHSQSNYEFSSIFEASKRPSILLEIRRTK